MRRFLGQSEAWRDDDRYFWLILEEEGDPCRVREDYMFVAEYGSFENAESAALLLSEHGTLICRDRAVETLSAL